MVSNYQREPGLLEEWLTPGLGQETGQMFQDACSDSWRCIEGTQAGANLKSFPLAKDRPIERQYE